MMRSSEAAQKKETPIYSGLTITNKQRTKVLKYLLVDRYYICKYIFFEDEKSLKQIRSFLIWRERGKAIMFDQSSQNSRHLRIDMPYFDSVGILQQQNLPRLIRNLIGQLILATNLNLYSIDNIMNNPITGQVQLNNISIVGIIALWKQTEFTFEEFKEIFELLTVEVFDEPTFDRKFSYQLKFRALGMVILKHICRKDISLLKAILKQNVPSKIKFVEGRQLCRKLPELFRSILSNQEIRQKILVAQKRDSLSYGLFLQLVFLDRQQQVKSALDWHKVISLLIPGSLGSKDSYMNGCLKDLQYIFMEYYNTLDDQTKEQLKSLGLEQKEWQILFKLSIGQNALDLHLQQYFKQARNARLNRQIIETTIMAIASKRGWISKALYHCFDVMRKNSDSSEENISTDIANSHNLGFAIPQGKKYNVMKIEMSQSSQQFVIQSASYQNQQQGVSFEVLQQVRAQQQIDKGRLFDKDSQNNGESLSNKEISISSKSLSSLSSMYYPQSGKKSSEKAISMEQIKILRNMANKFRAIEIKLQNTMIKALHPKMKMLNEFLRLSS